MHWLIIGAGLAGLTAGRTLADAGHRVTLAEKSRGLGGRLATRSTEFGGIDHGAQYLTARSKPFRALMTGLSNDGTVAPWTPADKDRTDEWHVGTPGMRDLATPLAKDLAIRLGSRVVRIERDGQRFDAMIESGDGTAISTFDAVISTAPAAQARDLLEPLDAQFQALGAVEMAPCWAGLFAFDQTEKRPFEFRRPSGDPLAWIACNGSKPQRRGETWIVHASPHWSRANLERERDDVIDDLLDAFSRDTGISAAPVHAKAHRWRYALVEKPLGRYFLSGCDERVFACGDWCLAPRAEAAFESARRLCDHIKSVHG